MTKENELLPCPFCGCQASIQKHGRIFNGEYGYRVECEGMCHAMTCYWHTKEEAITAWNTRHAPQSVDVGWLKRECRDYAIDNSKGDCGCGFGNYAIDYLTARYNIVKKSEETHDKNR